MKKNLTEIVFILDRSGSMSGLEADTIGGFNSLIEKQRKEEGEALVTTVLFDSRVEIIHDRVDLAGVGKLTEKEYFVRGCTALLDAVGSTIVHVRNVHKYIREEDVPEHTMFVITTDGMENASREYSLDSVKKLIGEQKEKGWEFLFLGANIDAVSAAGSIGIDADHAVRFVNDSRGIGVNYCAVSSAMAKHRRSEKFSSEWKAEIEADFEERANDPAGNKPGN